MIVQPENGYWQASGKGPLRHIVTEGKTRGEAMLAFMDFINEQWTELYRNPSLTIH